VEPCAAFDVVVSRFRRHGSCRPDRRPAVDPRRGVCPASGAGCAGRLRPTAQAGAPGDADRRPEMSAQHVRRGGGLRSRRRALPHSQALRDDSRSPAQNQSWVNRAATIDQVGRVAGGIPDTCSPVGTGGQSGCSMTGTANIPTNAAPAAPKRPRRPPTGSEGGRKVDRRAGLRLLPLPGQGEVSKLASLLASAAWVRVERAQGSRAREASATPHPAD
jgi:hypothetical protein